MRVVTFAAFGCLLLVAVSGCGVDKEKLYGKWELTEATAGMPPGTIWEFRKDGKLIVTSVRTGEFTYSVSGSVLTVEVFGKKDTTKIETLTDTQLVCRDGNGVTAKFKKVK